MYRVYLFFACVALALVAPAFAGHGVVAVRQRVVVRPVRQRVVVQRVVVPHVQQFVAPQAFYAAPQQFVQPYVQQFNAGGCQQQLQFNAGGCQALYR